LYENEDRSGNSVPFAASKKNDFCGFQEVFDEISANILTSARHGSAAQPSYLSKTAGERRDGGKGQLIRQPMANLPEQTFFFLTFVAARVVKLNCT
jgi:hypothetical protein